MEKLRQFALRHRRSLAAVLAGLSMLCAISAVTEKPAGVMIAVAAADLGSGHAVTPRDVRMTRVPPGAVPTARLTRARAVGRVVGGPMRRGEAFTDRRVLDPRHLAAGQVLATVPVDASAVALLRVGDVVDVLAAPEEGATTTTVAAGARIVVVRSGGQDESATLGVSTTAKSAAAVARAALGGRLTVVASSH